MRAAITTSVLLFIFIGCSGSIGGAADDPPEPRGDDTPPARSPGAAGAGGGAVVPPPGVPVAAPAGPPSAGPLPLMRLSRDELNNTIADLLGITGAPADVLPRDRLAESRFPTGNLIDDVDAQRLFEMVETVAVAALGQLPHLSECDAAARGEAACARDFITRFGRRAWRRPLETAEAAALEEVYTAFRKELGHDHPNGLRIVLETMLLSPSFLYHWGRGARRVGGLIKLGPHELASRLSYFLLRSMPDAELFAAADAGRLGTEAEVEAQARRLLATPRAEQAIVDFHQSWLELDGLDDVQKGKDFPPTGLAAAGRELDAMVRYVMRGDGKLATLLTAPLGFPDSVLARLYGVTAAGAAHQRVELPPTERAGVLTQIAFLARNGRDAESHPILRGVRVLEDLLCETKPPALPMVPEPRPATPDLTTRERYQQHATDGACAACHRVIDPFGFAFEHYDGHGRYRATDGKKPVDAKGEITTPGGQRFVFDSAIDLVRQLGASKAVRACFGRQTFRLATGRREVAADAAALTAIDRALERSVADLREVLVAVVTSPSFMSRAESAGEVLQ
jgi:hypothetical protein